MLSLTAHSSSPHDPAAAGLEPAPLLPDPIVPGTAGARPGTWAPAHRQSVHRGQDVNFDTKKQEDQDALLPLVQLMFLPR